MSTANPVKSPAPPNLVKQAAEPTNPLNVKLMEKAISMLNHLALHTCPDILHTMNVLSHYKARPTVQHWNLIKHLLR